MNSVQIEKLMEIVEDCGLTAEPLTSYWKIAAGGRSVYVAKTKAVTRVDISGFEIRHPAVRALTPDEAKEKRIGKVRGQLDFDKPEAKVLEAFRSALEKMKHLAEQAESDAAPPPTPARGRRKLAAVEPAAAPEPKRRGRKPAEHHA